MNMVIWSPVFHERFGLCFILDITKFPEYSLIKLHNKPILRITYAKNTTWNWIVILIHAKDDLPDALFMQPVLYMQLSIVI